MIKIICVSFIIFLVAVSGIQCSAETQKYNSSNFNSIKNKILLKLDEINNYQVDAAVSMDNNVASSQISGKQPDRLRIAQRITKGSEELSNTIIFDGQFQWIESKFSNKILQISKIKLSEVVDLDRPFDTGYNMQGAGIFGGESFPSTVRILISIYNLSGIRSADQIILSGSLNQEKFEAYADKRKFAKSNREHGFKDKFKKNFGYAILVFGKADFLLREYTIGRSKDDMKIKVVFQNLKINLDDIDNNFIYQVQEGVEPVDITDELKQALLNK